MRAPTPTHWLAASGAQGLAGLVLAALTAGAAPPWHDAAHAVALSVAAAFLAAGLALGLAPPLLRRQTDVPLLGPLAWLFALAGDVTLAFGSLRWGGALHGLALLLVVAHVPLAFARPRYEGDDLLRAQQPFRVGDRVAAALLASGALGLLASGLLLLLPPRDVPTSALALLVPAGALPLILGALAFLLPRLARAPLSGATLLGAALGLGLLAAAFLAWAYASPFSSDLRYPAATLALALLLALVALLRARLPDDLAPRFAALRPLLRGASALGLLAALAVFLALVVGAFQLTPLALDLLLALAAVAGCAAAVAAGPLLFAGEPRLGRWAAWGAGLVIAGMFLVAPAYQYPRSAFPGALVVAVGLALLASGLAGLRAPTRSSGRGAMRRR